MWVVLISILVIIQWHNWHRRVWNFLIYILIPHFPSETINWPRLTPIYVRSYRFKTCKWKISRGYIIRDQQCHAHRTWMTLPDLTRHFTVINRVEWRAPDGSIGSIAGQVQWRCFVISSGVMFVICNFSDCFIFPKSVLNVDNGQFLVDGEIWGIKMEIKNCTNVCVNYVTIQWSDMKLWPLLYRCT